MNNFVNFKLLVMVGLLSDYDQPLEDSSNAVIQKAEDEEQIIKAGENDEEVVERVLHVLTGQNENGKTVPDQSEGRDDSLNDDMI